MSEVPVEVLQGRTATVAGREVTWEPLPGGLSHHTGMAPADDIENTLAAAGRPPARPSVGGRYGEGGPCRRI